MAGIKHEIIDRLTEIQDKIWDTASTTVTESGTALKLGSPITIASRVSDIGAELSGLIGSIQFSFADAPEAFQLVLVPQNTLLDIASVATGNPTTEVDENTLSSVRPALEAVVQGICLSVGQLRSAPVAASGLTIRYQDVALPPNMEALDEVVRMQVALNGDDVNGTLIWLMDAYTASFIGGLEASEHNDESPFAQLGAHGIQGQQTENPENAGALGFLMDIPLEISVELGRVKMLVRDVIELGTGSIVEIDKAAGEPVDVMVNGRLVARGEVVVIEDNFGVRITEILTPQERLARLAEVA